MLFVTCRIAEGIFFWLLHADICQNPKPCVSRLLAGPDPEKRPLHIKKTSLNRVNALPYKP